MLTRFFPRHVCFRNIRLTDWGIKRPSRKVQIWERRFRTKREWMCELTILLAGGAIFLEYLWISAGGVKYLTVCLPLPRSLLTRGDTDRSAMSLLSFAKLFTSRRRDSSHGTIYRRGIDVSISLSLSPSPLIVGCGDSRKTLILLPRITALRSARKLISDRYLAALEKRQSRWSNNAVYARSNDTLLFIQARQSQSEHDFVYSR